MDVIDLIVTDHEELRDRCAALREAVARDDAARISELFAAQRVLLVAHHQTEEEVLFRLGIRTEALRGLIDEALEEHRLINAYLGYLLSAPRRIRPGAKAEVLAEAVEHHLAKEEMELFPAIRQVLSNEELSALAKPFADKEQARPTKIRGAAA